MIQNSYNRTIKLRNNYHGVPKIELVRVKSSINANREKITYDKSKNASEIFRKTNNMFGRIYKNNDVEFPMIKNF
jgi:anaerobic ribonucleoside-triphosphate reductase